MNDLKELLPLAARACGIVGTYVENYDGDYYYSGNTDGILYIRPDGNSDVWNPLTPGDGAEMEDKLRISVWRFEGCVSCSAALQPDDQDFEELYADHPGEGTARRWASLRVAAAIGRSMK